jgi:hypothetical protein
MLSCPDDFHFRLLFTSLVSGPFIHIIEFCPVSSYLRLLFTFLVSGRHVSSPQIGTFRLANHIAVPLAVR